MNKIGVILQE